MDIVGRAKALIDLCKAGLFEAKIGGGVGGSTTDENRPMITCGHFETNRGREFHYTTRAIGTLVSKEESDGEWDLRYVVIYEPGRKMAEVFLCFHDTELVGKVIVHSYAPLYFIGQVSPG